MRNSPPHILLLATAMALGIPCISLAETNQNQVPEDVIRRLCILEAAGKLPNVPGLTILSSEARHEETKDKKPPIDTFLVDLRVKAAGIEIVYRYFCNAARGHAILIQGLGAR